MKIDFHKLIDDIKYTDSKTSYMISYPFFIKYFKNIEKIKVDNLIVGTHFVYGWMPTVLNLNVTELKDVLSILNEAKKGFILNEDELLKLKKCINNSLVGTSKLLHFINPDKYAIWDSNIYRYIFGNYSLVRIEKPVLYLSYLKELEKISKQKDFKDFYSKVKNIVGYNITKIRAIELVMFSASKFNK